MTRVRVTAPAAAARPVTESSEAAQESDVGQVFVRSLIRSQLRLALVVAGGFLVILGAFPLLLAADRYSPPIADAFHHGRTVRDATKKSPVVREIRSP